MDENSGSNWLAMDVLMIHHGEVDAVHAGEGLVLVVVHATVVPDLAVVAVAVAAIVMINEGVAVMTIAEVRRRADPGLAVAAKAVTVAVTGVATAAVHAARAPARKLETDHQSPKKSHQVNQKEDTTKKTTDTMIDAVANVTTMKITTIGALLPVRDLGRVHDLVPRIEKFYRASCMGLDKGG